MRLLDVLNGAWAIKPDCLLEIQGIYRTHLRGDKIDLKGIEAQIGRPLKNQDQGYEVRDGVAIIPVEGVLAKKMNLFSQVSGGASTELIGRDFTDALRDPKVTNGIILNVDSPGGTVDGTQELATLIHANRGLMPIVTFSNGRMDSAAYWIGAAADRVYISGDTVEVGSIGVVANHQDVSKLEEKMGVKTTEITAGKFKRISSQYAPLTEEGAANIQDHVDHLYSVFVGDVAKFRGADEETVLKNMADGRLFFGQKAIKAGLVDGVSTLGGLIEQLAAGEQPSDLKIHNNGGIKMNIEELKNKFPEQIKSITDEARTLGLEEGLAKGREQGRKEGADAERIRIQDVESQIIPGHEALITALKFDGKTTGPEAAVKIVRAEKEIMARRNADFVADGQDVNVPVAPGPVLEKPKEAEKKGFFALVDEYVAEKKCSRTEAIQAVARINPEAHADYLKVINPGNKQ